MALRRQPPHNIRCRQRTNTRTSRRVPSSGCDMWQLAILLSNVSTCPTHGLEGPMGEAGGSRRLTTRSVWRRAQDGGWASGNLRRRPLTEDPRGQGRTIIYSSASCLFSLPFRRRRAAARNGGDDDGDDGQQRVKEREGGSTRRCIYNGEQQRGSVVLLTHSLTHSLCVRLTLDRARHQHHSCHRRHRPHRRRRRRPTRDTYHSLAPPHPPFPRTTIKAESLTHPSPR